MKHRVSWPKEGFMGSNHYRVFVGVDLGSWLHYVFVLDASGDYLGEGGFEHTAEGLAKMADWLLERANEQPAAIAVGVEKPHGAVVDTLLERGIAVYSINPKQVDRFRDRHSPSGFKDDPHDAFVLADALIKDRPCFQLVRPPSPQVIALRECLRIDEELCKLQVAVSNRLHEQLLRCQPHLLELAPDKNLIDLFFWEVLERFGSPEMARQADKQSIQSLLRQFRIRRLKAEEVLRILRQPPLRVAPATIEATTNHIALLLQQLRLALQQRRENTKQLNALLDKLCASNKGGSYTDAAVLASLPGVGPTVLATLLSYATEAIQHRDLAALRSLSGIAPVTKKSGKRRQVIMRRACIRLLRGALYHWARIAVMRDSHFKHHYSTLRAAGHHHARALRGVMDRILTIAMAMLRQGTLYDPSRFDDGSV
jgi:transposase